MSLTVTPFLGGAGSTLVAGQTAPAPAPNTLICDSGLLAAGNGTPAVYMVSVISGQQGTPDGSYANIYVNVNTANTSPVTGGVTVGTLTSFPTTNSGGTVQRFTVSLSAGQRILICVGNTAGGAGAVYCAGMSIAKRPSPYGDI